MKRFLWTFLLMAVFFFTLAPVSHAYKLEHDDNGDVLHWSRDDFPVPFKITTQAPVPSGQFLEAVKNAFAAWQAVKNASITFAYVGPTDSTKPAYDGENCIETGRHVTGSDVIGQTYIYYSTDDGRILDVDIVLNTSYRWATDGSSDKMDVQNAMTHEVGHLCGLDDLYAEEDSEKTMYGYMDYGETKKRTLEPDDKAGLEAIYTSGSSEGSGGGGGGSGCGTISPTNPPPGSNDINFLWIFLLVLVLGFRRFAYRHRGGRPA